MKKNLTIGFALLVLFTTFSSKRTFNKPTKSKRNNYKK